MITSIRPWCWPFSSPFVEKGELIFTSLFYWIRLFYHYIDCLIGLHCHAAKLPVDQSTEFELCEGMKCCRKNCIGTFIAPDWASSAGLGACTKGMWSAPWDKAGGCKTCLEHCWWQLQPQWLYALFLHHLCSDFLWERSDWFSPERMNCHKGTAEGGRNRLGREKGSSQLQSWP